MVSGMLHNVAASARAHGIRAHLLQAEDWHALLRAADLRAARELLARTPYRDAFAGPAATADSLPHMRTIEHALRSSTIQAMQLVLRFLRGGVRLLPRTLIQRYDLLNIKKTLRRLTQPERKDVRLAISNFDLGADAVVPRVAWDSVASLTDLGALLKQTYYRTAFERGFAAFSESHDLLMLESMLEKAYFDRLARTACMRRLPRRSPLRHLLGNYFDELSLTALVRLRFKNNIEPKTVFTLLPLDACLRLAKPLFWRVVQAANEPDCCALYSAAAHWAESTDNSLATVLHRLRRERQLLARRVFAQSMPVSGGPVVALYFLKELEVRDVVALLQAKRLKAPQMPEPSMLLDEAKEDHHP